MYNTSCHGNQTAFKTKMAATESSVRATEVDSEVCGHFITKYFSVGGEENEKCAGLNFLSTTAATPTGVLAPGQSGQ